MVRIFEAYANGMSLAQIAFMLNGEKVPPSQMARTQREPSWCKSAVKTVLRNTRYCGKVTWGCSSQAMNPENGRYIRRPVNESEWLVQERPELRIISDELWTKVQDHFVRRTRGFGVKRLGGMTRTERSRRYLLSGLLRCGVCKQNMTITSTKPSRYGCADHRNRNFCTNKASVRADVLERHLLEKLNFNLQSEVLQEELVQGLLEELNSARHV